MSAGLLPLAYLAANFACSDDGQRPREIGGTDLHHGSVDAGQDPTENPDGTGDSGVDPGADAATHSDPDAGVPGCGNGLIDPGEDCDVALPATESCVLRGFDTGTLACAADCRFDTSTCSGTENCYDGRDNDGDGAVDCGDADCAMPCVDACLAPPVVAEDAVLYGSTLGHGSTLASSCSDVAPSGREVVYQLNVSADAKLDVIVNSEQAINVSLRTSCEDDASELACGSQTRLTRSVYAGETYFIMLDGASAEDVGDYVLEVHTRQPACGDAVRDGGEECDDGNVNDGDGCDPDCNLEASEAEPNDTPAKANAFDANSPWFAQIDSEGDVDVFAVNLVGYYSTLAASTQNLGDGACGYNLMDTVVEILDTDARSNAVLATDDDGGDGKCSLAIASSLRPGTYYVRVKAKDGAVPDSFPYRLDLIIGVCGDGVISPGESCDDGNLAANDGCSTDCRSEVQ